MNELKVFENEKFGKIRVVSINGKSYVCGKDVATALGYSDTAQAIRTKCKGIVDFTTPTNGGNQLLKFIPESDIYRLIFGSKLDTAIDFQDWVFEEVLPTIRKTGGYISNSDLMVNTYFSSCDETSKQLVKGLLLNIEEQQAKVNILTAEIEHKNETINSLTKNISVAEKRQVLNRVVRYNTNNYQARWNELYRQFELKYHCDIKRRMDNYNENNKPKVKSKLDYIDKVMNKIPELYELACKLYESDVKALLNEMYGLVNL